VTSGVSAVTPRSLAVVCVPAVVGVVVVFALEYATDELEY
jgi:hypothetical protein